jgi:hypothetical protein
MAIKVFYNLTSEKSKDLSFLVPGLWLLEKRVEGGRFKAEG